METLSNWGMGSRTLAAFRAVIDAGGDTGIDAQDYVNEVERATRASADEGLVALGHTCPDSVAQAIFAITGSDDWTL